MRTLLCLVCLAACSTAPPPTDPPAAAPDAGDPVTPPTPDAAAPPAPDAEPAGRTVADCFDGAFANPPPIGPDYDQFGPAVGDHCLGTDHQDITGVERVVFLGDSVTVGTPPTGASDYYRSVLADRLAAHFGIAAPNGLWQQANIIDGTALLRESGAFASCAKWGARTDDLLRDSTQIEDCFPVDKRHLRTLVIMTVGGNDISSITQDGLEGLTLPELWAETESFVDLMRGAVAWFREPGRFPNGVDIVFANMFEFTDGTGNTSACPAAALAGFGAEWEDKDALADMVIWANEQYARIAVDHGADMIFLLETFCGHGFNHGDTSAPCYRGPDTPRWFDDTCIHPNPAGHEKMADMFMAVIQD